jgi:o-succinylbenzoate synthase
VPVVTAPDLIEYDLRIGDRSVTLLGGPGGWGEYSPLAGYPCDPAACRRAAEEAALIGFPPAVRDSIPVNALADASNFALNSFRDCSVIKVKLRAEHEIKVLAVLREEFGGAVALRVDANGAWDVDTAVRMIDLLERYDLEYVEQPVASLDDLARVRRRVNVPVAADECIRSLDDARRLRALDAADVIVLKQQPLGGVRAALEIAEAAGVPAVVSSMMETSVGIAAGVALAAALPELPYACGLATASMLTADVMFEPLVPVDGMLPVRAVTPDPELLARYSDWDQEARS